MRIRFRTIVGLTLAATLHAGGAHAQGAPVTAEDRKRAAAAFDEGVSLFKQADYAGAARAFLEADRKSPNAATIMNAIGAAKRAGDHLLVARTAERAIARGDAVVVAREALADAATRLARLELACEATPCTLRLDGEPAEAASYVLPGTHRIEARGAGDAAAEERVVAVAGATYRISLHPEAPVRPLAGPRPDEPARVPDEHPPSPGTPARGGLPPAAFFGGLGATALLAGCTLWSGIDAVAAKNALPSPASQAQEDDVHGRARRTDYLLLGAGLAGVGTAVLGIWVTRWSRPPPAGKLVPSPVALAAAPLPGGGAVLTGGRF
jgi:hypothetical protein